ncbi:alpha-ketoglutarate-dependent dioxygenase alkB homolog 4-like [Amphibalanus amphitrite]|uniref:alpha-ketoglutarate-dependent dioxygenase alkB homolog 4-like n=1 Tax=Amphibalanus amphitrite TaxID=1232801 RepID=UPI001C91FDD1|nr:alpha-ketoglutarate-dependent dioxygenase alkB homolog 4-like [Amphibalanus amphitrite]
MATNIPSCGCKGQNTCFRCEPFSSTAYEPFVRPQDAPSYVFCPLCRLAWPGWDGDSWRSHPHHEGRPLHYPGVDIVLDIISEEEERSLMSDIDAIPWDLSQSGRRKQNFGPKTNFNRRKLKMGSFKGFPEFGRRVQERLTREPVLAGYQTIEQCSLEYKANEGSCISPHIDDCWVWGERVVTLSLLSDSVLTMVKYTGGQDKYNMTYEPACRYNLPNQPHSTGSPNHEDETKMKTSAPTENGSGDASATPNLANVISSENSRVSNGGTRGASTPPSTTSPSAQEPLLWHQLSRPPTVRLPMPARSLLVMQAEARYEWLHGILRSDIAGRRVCLALREFTPAFMPGGEEEQLGAEVTAQAQCFFTPQTASGEVSA